MITHDAIVNVLYWKCSTLCVWWMMTALSESVSTTWKLSIVAVKKKKKKKVSIFAYFEMKLKNSNLLRFLFLNCILILTI